MLLIKLRKRKSASTQIVSHSNLYFYNVCMVRGKKIKKRGKNWKNLAVLLFLRTIHKERQIYL